MKFGIGLPATTPGVRGELILDWARKADAGPFSSVTILDRLVYPNFEALTTLAAVGAVTQRVRLMTSVLLAPLRNPAMLAKMAASIDALSNGRLTLGLGIGGRADDFEAAGVSMKRRGRIFEEELALMRRVWSGQPVSDTIGPIGPKVVSPNGPEILIGGYSPDAVRRVGKWGDGYIAGGAGPAQSLELYNKAEESWKEAGRPGKPRFVSAFYFGLGPNALERAGQYIKHYYAFMGPGAEGMAKSIPSTPEAVEQAIEARLQIGADEVLLWPCIAELDQVDRAAEIVHKLLSQHAPA
jgi:alkanesulfonate monooxygenase SsuD/methylene tetrahydromethanopterin reductase-like flavin-dependent oxidoreductase (luciferase family)